MSDSRDQASRVDAFVRAAVPPGGDVLLVVTPFSNADLPPFGPQLLQALGREEGFRIHVLHAHLLLAERISPSLYKTITGAANRSFLGERLFSAPAFGLPPLGHGRDKLRSRLEATRAVDLEWSEYESCAARAADWIEAVGRAIAGLDYRVVGCSTMFEQTASSVALLRRVKSLRPDTVAIIGGSNCEGEMAEGVASVCDEIDYIFSGESDVTFTEFLREMRTGRLPAERIITGEPFQDLDRLPTPSFEEYYRQVAWVFPPGEETQAFWDQIVIPYESSRGCWWGQKHHCTFCGLNGMGVGYRQKSADRVIQQLRRMEQDHPWEEFGIDKMRLTMTDNIMPRRYFRTLLPRLTEEFGNLKMFYEQKVNLTLDNVLALKAAGVEEIQAGIESLSTPSLRRMQKGTTAAMNIAVLRYATSARIVVRWNLLTDFPGEQLDELKQMLQLVPLLRHLSPPHGVIPLSIDRFSSYYDRPIKHGIRDIRPLEGYAEVFPPGTDRGKLAYFFKADYAGASREHPEIARELTERVRSWGEAWKPENAPPPLLEVRRASSPYRESTGSEFVLIDTRGEAGTTGILPLNRTQACTLLVKRAFERSPEVEWALERQLGVELDGSFVPLATAEVEVLRRFEREARDRRRARAR